MAAKCPNCSTKMNERIIGWGKRDWKGREVIEAIYECPSCGYDEVDMYVEAT